MGGVHFGEPIDALLDRLHARSVEQGQDLGSYFATRAREGTLDMNTMDERTERYLSDKLVALDRDKAELCYRLCRALRAKRVVEAGTSFGVSTLYLAAAVRDRHRARAREGEGRARALRRSRPRAVDRPARRRPAQDARWSSMNAK